MSASGTRGLSSATRRNATSNVCAKGRRRLTARICGKGNGRLHADRFLKIRRETAPSARTGTGTETGTGACARAGAGTARSAVPRRRRTMTPVVAAGQKRHGTQCGGGREYEEKASGLLHRSLLLNVVRASVHRGSKKRPASARSFSPCSQIKGKETTRKLKENVAENGVGNICPTSSGARTKKTPDRFRPGVKGDPGSARPSHPIFFAAAPLTDPSASFAEHALPVEMNLLIFENDYQVHFVKICIRRIPGLRKSPVSCVRMTFRAG